jgi:hypothetical protein
MSIIDEFARAIKSEKSIVVNAGGKPPPGALGAPRNTPQLILPPMNTDIRFENLPQFSVARGMRALRANAKPLPKKWDWRHKDIMDDSDVSKKKDLIEKPRQQLSCGSCWAISVAGIVGDMFVAEGIADYAPGLSTTYILSTYPQGQCGGGNPSLLYEHINGGGLASEHCVDYDWCSKNATCNPKGASNREGGKEFGSAEEKTKYVNSLIPPSGCFFPNNKKLYFVEGVEIASPADNDVTGFRSLIKRHLMDHGPVSAGYVVFLNFVTGNFSITKDIYLENIDYAAGPSLAPFVPEYVQGKMLGGHAVAVIGWGEEVDVPIGPGKKATIPYWYCRNSWGEQWGNDSGYFKYAMYPYNNKCGFDKAIEGVLGGLILSKASKIVEGAITKTIPSEFMNPSNVEFFKSESGPTNGGGGGGGDGGGGKVDPLGPGGKDNRMMIISVSIVCAIVVLLLLLWLVWFLYKRSKSMKHTDPIMSGFYEAPMYSRR